MIGTARNKVRLKVMSSTQRVLAFGTALLLFAMAALAVSLSCSRFVPVPSGDGIEADPKTVVSGRNYYERWRVGVATYQYLSDRESPENKYFIEGRVTLEGAEPGTRILVLEPGIIGSEPTLPLELRDEFNAHSVVGTVHYRHYVIAESGKYFRLETDSNEPWVLLIRPGWMWAYFPDMPVTKPLGPDSITRYNMLRLPEMVLPRGDVGWVFNPARE